jgi:hypothetical protein
MVAHAAAQPPLIALLPVGGPPSCGTWLVGPWSCCCPWGRKRAGGQGGRGGQKLIAAAVHSLPPGRRLCSTQRRLTAVAMMTTPTPPSAIVGVAASSRPADICGGEGMAVRRPHRQGGLSKQRPHASIGAAAAANAMTF